MQLRCLNWWLAACWPGANYCGNSTRWSKAQGVTNLPECSAYSFSWSYHFHLIWQLPRYSPVFHFHRQFPRKIKHYPQCLALDKHRFSPTKEFFWFAPYLLSLWMPMSTNPGCTDALNFSFDLLLPGQLAGNLRRRHIGHSRYQLQFNANSD